MYASKQRELKNNMLHRKEQDGERTFYKTLLNNKTNYSKQIFEVGKNA
jgi:hypothetical protein